MKAALIRAFAVFALAVGIGLIGCGSASSGASHVDSGQPVLDATAEREDGSDVGRTDGNADSDGPKDVRDDSVDPFQCHTVAPLVLSNPTVTSGTVAAGQTVTLEITLTDTDPNGYVSYPGVVMTSSTAGVTFLASANGPPGSSIAGTVSKPVTFQVTFDASIPAGTPVEFSARVYGWGHPAPDCNGFVLSFSLTTS